MKEDFRIDFYLPEENFCDNSSVKDSSPGYGYDLMDFKNRSFLSDMLFSIGMKHKRMAEYIARTVTGNGSITVTEVNTQYRIENIGHSVVLDALARTEEGDMINYEMQNAREPSLNERRRFYESSLAVSCLAKGECYDRMPKVISIYFLNEDIYRRGKAVYHSKWRDDEGNVTDSTVERYDVNLTYEGLESEIGRMIHDLKCSDYHDMETDVLRSEMEMIKNGKEEYMVEFQSDIATIMKKGYERGREQGIVQGKEEGRMQGLVQGRNQQKLESIEIMLREGFATPEQISKSFNVPLSSVKEIAEKLG